MKPAKPKNAKPAGAKEARQFPLVFGAVLLGLGAIIGIWFMLPRPKSSPEEPLLIFKTNVPPAPQVQTGATVKAASLPTNSIAASTNAPTKDAEVVDLMDKATELLQAGKPREAILVYQKALKLTPEDEDLHFNLGIAYSNAGEPAKAIAEYKEALRLFPDYAEAHNNLGNLFSKEGRFQEAVEHLKKATELQPDNASAHNNLGTALARQGQFNDAVVHYMEAVRLRPDYLEARCNLGNIYLIQNRVEEAQHEFEAALRDNPSFEPAARGLMKVKQRLAR